MKLDHYFVQNLNPEEAKDTVGGNINPAPLFDFTVKIVVGGILYADMLADSFMKGFNR